MKDLCRPDQGNCEPNGKGVHREVESEGSRRQSAGPTNRKRMRRVRWVRRQLGLKPETDPESVDVDATVISVKVLHLTRGDLVICPELLASQGAGRDCQKSAEAIVAVHREQ